jgi:hypothetical protein
MLAGCAGTPSGNVHDPSEGPSFVRIMERLAEQQNTYRKMAEAKNSVMIVLGALDIDIDVSPSIEVASPCPAVSGVARVDEASTDFGRDHDQRLAGALLLLDAELAASGHGSVGCLRH